MCMWKRTRERGWEGDREREWESEWERKSEKERVRVWGCVSDKKRWKPVYDKSKY